MSDPVHTHETTDANAKTVCNSKCPAKSRVAKAGPMVVADAGRRFAGRCHLATWANEELYTSMVWGTPGFSDLEQDVCKEYRAMKQDVSQPVDEAGRGNLAPARFALIKAAGSRAAVQAEFSNTADNSGLFCIYVLVADKIGAVVSFFVRGNIVILSAVRDREIHNFLSKRLFQLSLMLWYSLRMQICSELAVGV